MEQKEPPPLQISGYATGLLLRLSGPLSGAFRNLIRGGCISGVHFSKVFIIKHDYFTLNVSTFFTSKNARPPEYALGPLIVVCRLQ